MTSPDRPAADLAGAAAAVDLAQELVDQACASVRGRGGIDANQVVAYDVVARRRRGGHGPGRPPVRRAGERRGGHRRCLRGRRGGGPRGQGGRPRGALGRRAGLGDARVLFLGGRARPVGAGRAGGDRGAAAPRRGLRARARDVPPLRRGEGAPARRARAPHELGHPRRGHRGAGRARRLRPLGARGVRRLRVGRRERLHGHGRGDRGAQLGLARRRRLAHHPARDPHPGARVRRHRGAEEAVAAQARLGRDPGRGGGDRARLRLRRGQHRDVGDPGRRRAGSSTASRRGARSRHGPTC